MKCGARKGGEKSESYNAIHSWLLRHYGCGLKCVNCGVIGKRIGQKWSIEHALKPGYKHERNIDNYLMLCMSCHRKQDMNEEILSNLRKAWVKRKEQYGLNKTDVATGRFVKHEIDD